MKRALELHKRGAAVVIPIMLRRCDIEFSPFSNLQGLPENLEPVKSQYWHTEDDAFYNIVMGLKKTIKRIRKKDLGKGDT